MVNHPGTLVTIEGEAKPAPPGPERLCHLLRLDGSMVALCGFDCTGRSVHASETCVIEGHPRCAECALREGGGVERFLRDLLDDRPF